MILNALAQTEKTYNFNQQMEDSASPPLHHCHVHRLRGLLNRAYSLLHFLAMGAIFYYRLSSFFNTNYPKYHTTTSLFVFVAELFYFFLWFLKEPFHWFPVTRTVFPERLPEDSGLPKIDVFICTADPEKEPTFEVMNTVISAMALDYPAQKLSVYLSDDGGASVTLMGMKEAWCFATWWLPFSRKYHVFPICPRAYFEEGPQDQTHHNNLEFIQDRQIIKEKYEAFKQRVQRKWRDGLQNDAKRSPQNHPAFIQVINENSIEDEGASMNPEHVDMPLLVYVAREKIPSYPHHFKAGALNTIMRVSGIMSNAPYILVLDCDMYCNDSISARQAMCFYVDCKTPSSLGWVQFPQKFHNVNETDVYGSQLRSFYNVCWVGVDGLQGPVICGTNFYIKREALYGVDVDNGSMPMKTRDCFGPSNEFLKSLSHNERLNANKGKEISPTLLKEALFLASCAYEKDTKWGDTVGFRNGVSEDIMTGFYLQSKGWRSFYLNPTRAQFLGTATNTLDETLVQSTRWYVGVLVNGLSKYCPLIYRPSRMSLLHKMASSWLPLLPLECFPISIFLVIPPLCFFYGLPLFPKVSDPLFVAFAFVLVSSRAKGAYDFTSSGASLRSWMNDDGCWIRKSFICGTYGTLYSLMSKLGIRDISFIPTNKAGGKEKTKYYQMGMYDFRTSNMLLLPLVSVVTLNLICLLGGLVWLVTTQCWDTLMAQLIISLFVTVMSFHEIEGMFFRKDDGCVPFSATIISFMASFIVLSLGYFIF